MQAITAKKVFLFVVVVLSMSALVGCSHMEKAPNDRPGYLYYHKPLPEAARALDEARMAGKDKECPAEYNAAKNMVDKAYETYLACFTKEGIDMAQNAIGKIKALCPPKPVAEMKPEPKPEPIVTPPTPAPTPPPPAPVAEPVKITLEDVHFDFDKATLTNAAVVILNRDINTMKENPGVMVQIEGHTCAHGSEDYNMALGERRAHAVKEYLANQGIAAGRMTTISYGETRLAMPEIPTAHNKNSTEAKANRRIHFEVIVK
ncbi:MAG: OmpA family protein [Thermodesulfovibrionales bacterium]